MNTLTSSKIQIMQTTLNHENKSDRYLICEISSKR